jgi:hypothetical protein
MSKLFGMIEKVASADLKLILTKTGTKGLLNRRWSVGVTREARKSQTRFGTSERVTRVPVL